MARNKINNPDSELFRETVGDIKRLDNDRIESSKPLPRPIPKQSQIDDAQVIDEMLSDHYDPMQLDLGDEISFRRPGVQHSVMRKLKRGQYSIGAELDLHGMTIPQARRALVEFLNACRQAQKKCVRIIHGKGRRSSNKGPVLKPMVANWLTQLDDVLAYTTSRPIDGGTGALYVLLKG